MTMILLSLLAAVFFSFQGLFTKLYTNHYPEHGKEMAGSVFTILYGLMISAVSFAIGGGAFSPSWPTFLFALASGLMLLLYNMSMVSAATRGPYSFMMICSMTGGILVPVAAGALFFGESLSAVQILAIALMLAALVIMNSRGLALTGASKGYYLWCMLLFLSNGLYSAVLNAQATVMDGGEHTEMLVMLFFFSSCFASVREFAAGRGRKLREGFRMGKKAFLLVVICCLSAAGGANLMLYLFSQMDSGILCAIVNGATLVLAILYSFLLFTERPGKWQIAGMACAAVSIVLINQSLS